MPSLPSTTTEDSNDQPFEPMQGEDPRWYERFSQYLALGAARSVRAVYNAELATRGKPSEHSKPVPSSWTQKSREFRWVQRAEAYDAWRRKQVFSTGNAQDTERVRKLDALAERMHGAILANIDSMPVDDKYLGKYLDVLDMLAKLTGGYAPAKQLVEHTGKDGAPIEIEEKAKVIFYMPEIDPVDQVAIGDGDGAGQADEVSGDSGERP